MKKVLTTLCLVGMIGLFTPAIAAPSGPPPGGHKVHAGAHHRPQVRHHHGHHRHYRGGIMFHTGHSKHRCWRSNGLGYWYDPWCDCRLGFIDCYNPRCRYHNPFGRVGVSINF